MYLTIGASYIFRNNLFASEQPRKFLVLPTVVFFSGSKFLLNLELSNTNSLVTTPDFP